MKVSKIHAQVIKVDEYPNKEATVYENRNSRTETSKLHIDEHWLMQLNNLFRIRRVILLFFRILSHSNACKSRRKKERLMNTKSINYKRTRDHGKTRILANSMFPVYEGKLRGNEAT